MPPPVPGTSADAGWHDPRDHRLSEHHQRRQGADAHAGQGQETVAARQVTVVVLNASAERMPCAPGEKGGSQADDETDQRDGLYDAVMLVRTRPWNDGVAHRHRPKEYRRR